MYSWGIAAVLLSVVPQPGLNPELERYVQARAAEYDEIDVPRKQQLDEVAEFVRGRVESGKLARLTFICTHNSRRSHLAQIWAKTAAQYYGVAEIDTFSGGTEATAFNIRAVNALRRSGFDISVNAVTQQNNPRYLVRFSSGAPALECFSKAYSDAPNPSAEFCAVMTCSQADKACPVVSGASKRVSLPYEDPKAFDGTPEEAERYDERCRQIAREMLYVFWRAATVKTDRQ
jgi:protein-tyrosine-phosphatase